MYIFVAMLTFGLLRHQPQRLNELKGADVLVGGGGNTEVVRDQVARTVEVDATMVFAHETIAIMKAERASRLEHLRRIIADGSTVIPLTKRSQGFWEHVTLGRVSTADIVLTDPAVSNMHAEFVRDGEGHASIVDMGSSNGTFVNRVPLQAHNPAALVSGDCVRVGQTVFYFVSHDTLQILLRKTI